MIEQSGAIFDPTGRYRYRLWRSWERAAPRLMVVMLNPSTADATHNDATLRRCVGLSQVWGFGALDVVNLFAACATRPADLRRIPQPVGKENDHTICRTVEKADAILLAWGNGGTWQGRDRTLLTLLYTVAPHKPQYCLGFTQARQPRHPLYVSRHTLLQNFSLQDFGQ
ncbi:MAG: DUF1643 domain-containing protein [Kaiparowitsia implicata GSE-PSE-MK54-09C]|nr:DUF1643 domain-containing protein [Kaiparowitsia implicata GSE-PSE-MK54-09C]